MDCLVSSSLTEEMFLSWEDLIRIGVLPKHFPEVWIEETHSSKKTTSENKVLDEIMEEFNDVLNDDLSDGRRM